MGAFSWEKPEGTSIILPQSHSFSIFHYSMEWNPRRKEAIEKLDAVLCLGIEKYLLQVIKIKTGKTHQWIYLKEDISITAASFFCFSCSCKFTLTH